MDKSQDPIVGLEHGAVPDSHDSNDNFSVTKSTTRANVVKHVREKWLARLGGVLCVSLHVLLVAAFVILLLASILQWHQLPSISTDKITEAQISLSLKASAVGMTYFLLLVWSTQRIMISHEMAGKDNPTLLDDQLIYWFGLGVTVEETIRKSRLGCAFLPGVYLLCIFGLQISTPVLFQMGTVDVASLTNESIIAMTPGDGYVASIPYQALPALAMEALPQTGLNGSTIYEYLRPNRLSLNTITSIPNPEKQQATTCATTFSTDCEFMTLADVAVTPANTGWNASFADEWTTTVQVHGRNAYSSLRVVPAPDSDGAGHPNTDYVILVANWDVIDTKTGQLGPTNSSASHGLSFLKCKLRWDVRSATISGSGALLNMSTDMGMCDRGHAPSGSLSPFDVVNFNWTAPWPVAMTWENVWDNEQDTGGRGVPNTTVNATYASTLERYLMLRLGWRLDFYSSIHYPNAGDYGRQPSLQDISAGLANVTATVFWLAATVNRYSGYGAYAQVREMTPRTCVRVNTGAAIASLVMSVISVACLIIILRNYQAKLKAKHEHEAWEMGTGVEAFMRK